MQPQPDPIVNAHRSVGSGSLEQAGGPPEAQVGRAAHHKATDAGSIPAQNGHLPFRMRHKRADHGELCDANRCEDESVVLYGEHTELGRRYKRTETRLCDRHLRLFYRWLETT